MSSTFLQHKFAFWEEWWRSMLTSGAFLWENPKTDHWFDIVWTTVHQRNRWIHLEKDSSVSLMHRDPNDLGSIIRFRIFPKKRTLRQSLLKGFPPCSINLALHLLMFWTFQISFHSYYWVIVLLPEFFNNFIQIKHFGIMAWSGRRLQSFVLLRRKSIMAICTKTKHNMIVKNTFMINKSQIVHLSSLAQACE